jgi:hypothetical protein
MTAAISKDRHVRIIIMRPETILHYRPDTFSQTVSRRYRFFLQFGGGPYITPFDIQKTGSLVQSR